MTDIYRLVASGKTDLAADMIFDRVDDLLCAGQFQEVDALLERIDVEQLDITACLCFLSVCLRAEPHLAAWPGMVQRVAARVRTLAPDRYERLMRGLTGGVPIPPQ